MAFCRGWIRIRRTKARPTCHRSRLRRHTEIIGGKTPIEVIHKRIPVEPLKGICESKIDIRPRPWPLGWLFARVSPSCITRLPKGTDSHKASTPCCVGFGVEASLACSTSRFQRLRHPKVRLAPRRCEKSDTPASVAASVRGMWARILQYFSSMLVTRM